MSFQELIAIRDEAKQVRAEDMAAPLVDCSNCGEPLVFNEARGLWACPHGDFLRLGGAEGPAREVGE